MTEIEQKMYDIGLIPVIRIEDAADAAPLSEALCEGGLPAAEVTFRTACAAEAIRRMCAAQPAMLVGAGTVLTTAQVDEAVGAGAQFIVSPGLNPEIVSYCLARQIPVIPGCATPSDVEKALSLGLKTVKFFPAEASGGLPMLKAMSAPYGGVRFMPTGGITPENMASYLNFDRILACGGTFMVKDDDLRRRDFAAIREKTRAAVLAMFDFRLWHVGINTENETEALAGVRLLGTMFGQPVRELPGAYFFGGWFEVMKKQGRGKNGHIGISTNCIERAVAYFERLGFAFAAESRGYDDKGRLTVIYFREDVLGFALHLTARR